MKTFKNQSQQDSGFAQMLPVFILLRGNLYQENSTVEDIDIVKLAKEFADKGYMFVSKNYEPAILNVG